MTDSAISDLPVGFGLSGSRTGTNAHFAENRKRAPANLVLLIFSGAIVALLWVGWLDRDDSGLTPQSGVGYWLGVSGSVLMLLLLLYPLRKRMRSLRVIGTVGFWFRVHMTLGVLGPVLILWHTNFKLGSINSSVALIAMLVVAASGLVGRFLHGKVHRGLHGQQALLREIMADAQALKRIVGADPAAADRVIAQLNALTRFGTTAPKGTLAGLVLLPLMRLRGAVVRRRLITDVGEVIAVEGWRAGRPRSVQRRQLARVADFVKFHVAAVERAAAFAVYERLFRLWHAFHVPLT